MKFKYKNVVCLYHANCFDGFAAAFVVRHYCEVNKIPCEAIPVEYGKVDAALNVPAGCEAADALTGKDVVIVDFALPVDVMLSFMHGGPNTVTWLDHHKSAVEQWQPIDSRIGLPRFYLPVYTARNAVIEGLAVKDVEAIKNKFDFYLAHDNQRSGCMLAWEYFFPNQKAPLLLEYIQDRDLWTFKMAATDSDSVICGLSAIERHFDTWYYYLLEFDSETNTHHPVEDCNELIEGGGWILQNRRNIIADIVRTKHPIEVEGQIVQAANCTGHFASEVANALAESAPFGVAYYDDGERRVFSLRSDKDGADVSAIAKKFGGGGHKHAAGFSIPKHLIVFFHRTTLQLSALDYSFVVNSDSLADD